MKIYAIEGLDCRYTFAIREHAERYLANNPPAPLPEGVCRTAPQIVETELLSYDMNPLEAIELAWFDETQIRGVNKAPGVFA